MVDRLGNAEEPNVGAFPLKYMFDKAVQLLNAEVPMLVIVLGMLRDFNPVQP